MGKQEGTKLVGTFWVWFIIRLMEYYVRKKSNLNKERVLNDVSYENFRKSGSEFGFVSRFGKLVRVALRGYITDKKCDYRLNKVLMELKGRCRFELVDSLVDGLKLDFGRKILKGFDFNGVSLSDVLRVSFNVDYEVGCLVLKGFDVNNDLNWNKYASHVKMSLLSVNVDVEGDFSSLCVGNEVVIGRDDPLSNTSTTLSNQREQMILIWSWLLRVCCMFCVLSFMIW